MYKSNIVTALTQIQGPAEGVVSGLLERLVDARSGIDEAVTEIAKNNEANIKAGCFRLHQAIQAIEQRLNEVSPSATVVELHLLGKRFDRILFDYPLLETLLRPGRQALGGLAGAFDVALQEHRNHPALINLVTPGVALARELDYYRGLIGMLSVAIDSSVTEQVSIIEIEGAERLDQFDNFIALLTKLSLIATSILNEMDNISDSSDAGVTIESIESGSPIQIRLGGKGKTLRFLLAMLRDLIRLPYLHLTKRGQFMQSIETYAYAKNLGVDTPEVLRNLEWAMSEASRIYVEKVAPNVVITIDGRNATENEPLLLSSAIREMTSKLSEPLSLPKE